MESLETLPITVTDTVFNSSVCFEGRYWTYMDGDKPVGSGEVPFCLLALFHGPGLQWRQSWCMMSGRGGGSWGWRLWVGGCGGGRGGGGGSRLALYRLVLHVVWDA